MAIIDIEHILQANNVGKNFEDESIFYHLERLLRGKKEILDTDAKTVLAQAEPPMWSEALDVSLELLEQSKDLRIAASLVRCLIALHGLAGCEIGFKLIVEMLEKYGNDIYPIPEDEDDNIIRINALSSLNDWSETLVFLTQTTVINSKSSKLAFRVFGLTANKLQPRENEQILSTTQLKYVMTEVSQDIKDNVSELIAKITSYILSIKNKYDETIGVTPDFSALLDILNWVKHYLQATDNSNIYVVKGAENIAVSAPNMVAMTDRVNTAKKLSTRKDVIDMLEEICVFLEQSEPAHPAPLFIRRGQKLLGMSFLEIVRELSPDAYDEVCKLGGVRQDD